MCRKNLDPVFHRTDGLRLAGCELVAVSFLNKRLSLERILIVSIYKPPDIGMSVNQWRDLFEGLIRISNSPHIIVVGDFNAQSEAWGSSRENGPGISLHKFLINSQFFFLNDGSGTRVSATTNYNSVPDVSITNCRNIKFEWSIGDDPMGSDHIPVIIHLSNSLASSLRTSPNNSLEYRNRPKICLKNFDKELFKIKVQKEINSLTDSPSEDALEIWEDFILNCSLEAGAIFYDGLGGKKEFVKNKINISSFNNNKNNKKKNNKHKGKR